MFTAMTMEYNLNKALQTRKHWWKKVALSAGFEPAREDPNGFLVHRLNHSATTTVLERSQELMLCMHRFFFLLILRQQKTIPGSTGGRTQDLSRVKRA